MGECICNYKYLEFVSFPKELFTHTDVSFDGSYNIELPSASAHHTVSPSGSQTLQLSPHPPIHLLRWSISHQQVEIVSNWRGNLAQVK